VAVIVVMAMAVFVAVGVRAAVGVGVDRLAVAMALAAERLIVEGGVHGRMRLAILALPGYALRHR
jgi:hypothetical protein